MLKITLLALNSSYSHTNPAVRCIAANLRGNGFGADFLEFNLKDRRGRILSALYDAGADIYGFSAYIWNIRELLSFASDLAKLRPSAKLVFGGPEVSYNADELIAANPFISCVITGEGEDAFVRAARYVEAGAALPRVIDGGIYSGFVNGGIPYSPDELRGETRMLYYESARGCPYRCAYCLSALSGRVRAKTAERTLAELLEFERLAADIKVIKFVDRTFNFDRERAKTIWRGLLSERYTKRYHFEICAELLDEESFGILASFPSGKLQLEIGVQSTNPATLARVSRHTDIEKLLAAISRLHSAGNMHIHADLIAGLPGEDFASFGRSFDALAGRCDMLQLGFLKLLRGSALRAGAESFGCVYSDTPPYTVLATDCLSFGELERLHRIDALLERYMNSGVFARSVRVVTEREASVFGLLCRLESDFNNAGLSVTELSQPSAFGAFYDFLHQGGDRVLAAALTLDFLTSQKTSPPVFGGFTLERIDNPELKHKFMRIADSLGIGYFAPSLEVRRADMPADKRAAPQTEDFCCIIDRRNCRAFRLSDGGIDEI